jgi:hypothetical protein
MPPEFPFQAIPNLAELPLFPTQAIRNLLDPSARYRKLDGQDALRSIAADAPAATIPELGQLSPYENILVLGLHAGIDARKDDIDHGVALPLPYISIDRQVEITRLTRAKAREQAAVVGEITRELYAELLQRPGINIKRAPSLLDIAGIGLSAHVHKGVFRKTGREYFKHPDEVARSIDIAWGIPVDIEDRQQRDRVKFVGRLHDGYEQAIGRSSWNILSYLGQSALISSPLVIEETLRNIGDPRARPVSRAIRMLTRTVDHLENRMPYVRYIGDALIENLFELVELPKDADIHNNRDIEPHPNVAKAKRKRVDYNWGERAIKHAILIRGDTRTLDMVNRIGETTTPDFEAQREQEKRDGVYIDEHNAAFMIEQALAA